MGLPGFVTTDGGAPNTRFKAPVLSGTIGDSVTSGPGPLPPVGGFMCVQSTVSPLNQIVTASSATSNASFMYITQGSLGMSSSTNSNIAASPFYTGCGAAIYFDFTRKKLSVFSTGVGDWLSVTLTSS